MYRFHYFVYLTVCLEIRLKIDEQSAQETNITQGSSPKVRWKLGTCSSVNSDIANTVYQYGSTFVERCCILPGRHTLTCDSSIPTRGWKGAYLNIGGHTYCDNFIGYKLMQKIFAGGTNSFIKIH